MSSCRRARRIDPQIPVADPATRNQHHDCAIAEVEPPGRP
jgi:hypothetical protein